MQQQVADLTICDMYQQGLSIVKLSAALSLPYQYVRKVLEYSHVPIRSRVMTSKAGSNHPSSKLSAENREILMALLKKGGTQHSSLAEQFGITRERVRQIAKAIGAPTGRTIKNKMREARQKSKLQAQFLSAQQRKDRQVARYMPWRELWRQGLKLQEMAQQLNLSYKAMGVRITELRKTNPDWFPYRRKQTSVAPTLP